MAALPRLFQIPTITISDYIDGQTLLDLRLTCRAIKLETNRLFIKRYIHTRRVMMGYRSLENLICISESDLGPFVEALEICVDHYVQKPDEHYEALEEEMKWYRLQALSKLGLMNEYIE